MMFGHFNVSLLAGEALILLFVSANVLSQYSGGSGTAEDPYRIAKVADLIAIGNEPNDYDKHFILTVDIDLDPNLPGGKVFDRAVIAPVRHRPSSRGGYLLFSGDPFMGVFSGNGFKLTNLTIDGQAGVALFGAIASEAIVRDLCVDQARIQATDVAGILAAWNEGQVVNCGSMGVISVSTYAGGLVGVNLGSITACFSHCTVEGIGFLGGLVGTNFFDIFSSWSVGTVKGEHWNGGLVAHNYSYIVNSYSACIVSGSRVCGGLVGGGVNTDGISGCFWDVEISGQEVSDGGLGLTTVDMQTAATFLNAGWDFVGETENGPNDIWKIVEGVTYPLLSWQKYGGGTGEPNAPYLIYTAEHLNALGAEPDDYDKHFKLMADIDLSLYSYDRAVIAPDTNDIGYGYEETPFNGVFDGNGKFLSNLRITGEDYLGLFGKMEADAEVKGLGLVDVNIVGTGTYIGGLAGWSDGSINRCYSTGDVSGYYGVGGLVGFQRRGNISVCHSQCTVEGSYIIGGLTGETYRWASISCSHSTGTIKGEGHVGGLAGTLFGKITTCRSTSIIEGKEYVGGFVGAAYQENGQQALIANCYCSGAVYGDFGVGGFLGMDVRGIITNCYSTSFVSGNNRTGGFAGWFRGNTGGRGVDPEREDPSCCTTASFWDFEASEFQDSDGGIGLTTTQMQTITTFLDAGWDFLGETENGTDDIWWIDEGRDYPRLWWELEQ